MATQWEALVSDFDTGFWTMNLTLMPLLESQLKAFGEKQAGAPWKAMDVGCGMGKHSVRLLRAGASYVLAFDVAKSMVKGAKMEVDKFLHAQALPGIKVDVVEGSATDLSCIPGAHEGTFDLAICIFLFCNLLSKEEVKQALAEIFRTLKPGGKLIIYENHLVLALQWNKTNSPLFKHVQPKDDGTEWNYFEDEGKPRELRMRMNSGSEIKIITRMYTLSSWVSWIVEAGFQITQLHEPHVDSSLAISGDASDNVKLVAGQPVEMCWECTKPLSR